ncbi:MAG: UDP-3-O-(3-hydroxymyristoyl)glucosamine N-acyltransferase [Rhodospirillales bacterium]|jgi:UDP-3-O-[3-hydroxymyristoyl] glucosamine N-acyltransferase|nr:UDP-3-O-(3-hydroxymyristoyl)glucosamine N-acyltransferase [Rhodospirillales bacterium]
MADSRFFAVAGPFTLAQLAEISGAEMGGDADPGMEFSDVSALETATKSDVGFLDNKRYVDAFSQSGAGACLVHPNVAAKAPKGMALLLTKDPYRAYAKVAQAFYPSDKIEEGVSPRALVDPTVELGEGCSVEAGAVIGADARIGLRCRIGANAVIGAGVDIGDDCVIGPCASLTHSRIGKRVVIHAGVRAGQDGFGFALGPQGHEKVPQLGRVIIGDDVEIGANTTIDRGAGPDTIIGAGTKIDNLVQIAHNVELGRGCIVVSQVGISGSTKVGDFAMMGGQVGLTGHLKIGTGAKIAAQSGVMRDVEPGATVAGSPAMPAREYWRQIATLAGLSKKKGRGTE